jgi:hypothetical protein
MTLDLRFMTPPPHHHMDTKEFIIYFLQQVLGASETENISPNKY